MNRQARGLYLTRKVEYSRKLKDERGGKCVLCGYNKNYAALVWHHIDMRDKELHMADSVTLNSKTELEKTREESKKCVLLCCRCHAEIHYPHLNKEV